MRATAPTHYLRRNHAEWAPGTIVLLDTETRTVPEADREVLALRLWCARLIDRRPLRNKRQDDVWADGDTAAELVAQIDRWFVGRKSVWLFAHNLAFDLVTTRLPLVMAAAGWTVTDAAVSGKAPWIRMRRGDRRLCVVDSTSWLPTSIAELGAQLGTVKPDLPAEDDTRARWLHRCRTDVTILADAICSLMEWWESAKLGRWSITGAGCGWNAMRHKLQVEQVTINTEDAGARADRLAVHGGRRGVWRVGELRSGPFLELDFVSAYPSIAAKLPLPAGRKTAFTSMALDDHRLSSDRWGVIADVVVNTDVPRWPVKIRGREWFGVGRFATTLAGPEIADAIRLGCLESIGAGYVHQLNYALEPWALWCLDVLAGRIPDAPPTARIAAKAWSRSVLGKFCQHGFDKIELGSSPADGWGFEDAFDHDRQARGSVVDLGGRRWVSFQSGEGDNAYPALWAWVESAVRVRLSRVIEAIGPGAVVQADTDGLIVNERLIGTRAARGHLIAPDGMTGPARAKWILDCLDPVLAPLVLRIKRTAHHVNVSGPQHLTVDSQRRMAGMPRTATEQADGTYVAKLWPGLGWQMTHGDPRGYVRPQRTFHVRQHHVAGWVTTDNRVIPVAFTLTPQGETQLLPWSATPRYDEDTALVPVQHPTLDELWR